MRYWDAVDADRGVAHVNRATCCHILTGSFKIFKPLVEISTTDLQLWAAPQIYVETLCTCTTSSGSSAADSRLRNCNLGTNRPFPQISIFPTEILGTGY